MKYQIRNAVVIGAGTMGAAIAAHLANAGVRVALLDIVPRELTPPEEEQGLTLEDRVVRDRLAREGLDRAKKARPANFFNDAAVNLVSVGNLEDDFEQIASADWVIEAIIENLKIKRQLMERIEATRSPRTIVSTNTSGLPVGDIAEGRSKEFRKHFLGTHFFNPPRYLKLVELIPIDDTLPEVMDFMEHFLEFRLGKGVVRAKDTPNFIANRLGSGTGAFAMDYILEHGYTVPEVDAVTGPPLGRPKTATFRLIDLVGIDVWEHVGKNLAPAIPHDEQAMPYLQSDRANNLIRTMVEQGWHGNKTNVGFYKEVRKDGKKEFWPLNLQTLEHEEPQKVRFESVGKAKDAPFPKRLEILLEGDDRAAELARALTYQGMSYASHRIPEIGDTPLPLDNATRWGFMHDAGPFEIWDALGVKETAEKMREAGFPPAEWVGEMLASGNKTFYQYEGDRKVGVYNPIEGDYEKIERPSWLITLPERKDAGKVIQKNESATLIDLDDGVALIEFHTKMNALDEDIFKMAQEAMHCLEGDFDGLVIGNEADNFSAGANLFMVVMLAQQGDWDTLDGAIRMMQDINMQMRYSPTPVVVAPAGMALGGGAEIIMHGNRVVASSELYAGMVEVGAGVIPAGGGTKEMIRRVLNPAMRTKSAEPLPYLQRLFEQIGMAQVSRSAEQAREMGILSPCDRVVFNRDHLLAEAKKEVLHMLERGYRPPAPEQIYAAGRDALAAMRVGIHMMKEGGFITEYESHIGGKLAYVLTGGELTVPTWVDEQYILDLEREAFLSLCGEEKTQQRMWNLLQTGKPLRN